MNTQNEYGLNTWNWIVMNTYDMWCGTFLHKERQLFCMVSGLPPFGWAVSNPCGVLHRHPGARSCSWCSDCTGWSFRNFKSQLFGCRFSTKNHLLVGPNQPGDVKVRLSGLGIFKILKSKVWALCLLVWLWAFTIRWIPLLLWSSHLFLGLQQLGDVLRPEDEVLE